MHPPLTSSVDLHHFMTTMMGSTVFRGVYPKLQLPNRITLPLALIVNTEPMCEPGEHWCAFYWDRKGNGFFYDPQGKPPQFPEWIDFMVNMAPMGTWGFCVDNAQGKYSRKCGIFVALFLLRIHNTQHEIDVNKLMRDVNDHNVLSKLASFKPNHPERPLK